MKYYYWMNFLLNRLTAVGIRCADHVTPLYPQKLSLTSPTGGGRSVGIVRSRTKATEFFFFNFLLHLVPEMLGFGLMLGVVEVCQFSEVVRDPGR